MRARNCKMSRLLEYILYVEVDDLRLKWLFDHVRNYGLAAAVVAAGVFTFQQETDLVLRVFMGKIIGIVLMLTGLMLLAFNFLQPILIMVRLKIRGVPYYAVYFVLYFSALKFTWALVSSYLNV
ncbi:hypothetical protein LGV61_11045 [Desulfurispirillum indicum]|uniref:hypothetical protein n=1 Tax=Desulfurispirillum indicum TaxID=936456 RepID=UPI001CFB164C|nr:hypothetical protein [Desulfurispirillum indicum]UCZ56252.1 hypothetical protein LGV61_11045 [Desulfurispirillum indicum]